MKRFSCLLFCLTLLSCSNDSGNPPASAGKEILRRRVASLEEENRQLAAENDRLSRDLGELRGVREGNLPTPPPDDDPEASIDPEQSLRAERQKLLEELADLGEQFEQQIALLEAMNNAFEDEIASLQMQIEMLEAENLRLGDDQ